ncbi:MAG TPA: hypothetical protein PK522_00730 [Nitrosomonas sp.]|nr:hypothetical protein [Nitrosomonas sp.]
MIRQLILALLISTQAFAGLPPTTSKGISDTANQTTFNFQFPQLVPTRTGTTTSLSPPENGAFVKNYIRNGNAESGATTGWAVYDDGAAVPVDGTGGSPVLTLAASNSGPLAGTYSYLNSKGNAISGFGNGFSYDFTIDQSDTAKVLQIQYDYLLTGAYTLGSDSTTGTWVTYLYDVTNAQLIQPTSYKLLGGGRFIGNFQTNSNSTSYRLIIHNSQVQLSPATFKFDSVIITPTVYAFGTPITDWQSYTPTFTGFGTAASIECQWRRVGSNVELRNKFTTGTPTGVEARVSLPTGLTIASTSTVPSIQPLGQVYRGTTGAANIYYAQATAGLTYLTIAKQDSVGPFASTLGTSFGSAEVVYLQSSVPIQGWSSSVQTSDQADSRTLIEAYNNNAGTVLTANTTNIDFSTKVTDTHGAWSGTVFTANAPGNYSIKGSISCTTGASRAFYAYVNGTQNKLVAVTTTGNVTPFVADTFLNANDTFSLRSNASCTLNAVATDHWINITRSPSSSVISATETVAASYYASANQTTAAQINFDTKEYDTHGAVTTGAGAWKFSAPYSGLYSINVTGYSTSNTNVSIFKNGSNYKYLFYTVPSENGRTGSAQVRLSAGEYVDIRPSASVQINGGAQNAVVTSRIEILRVGN